MSAICITHVQRSHDLKHFDCDLLQIRRSYTFLIVNSLQFKQKGRPRLTLNIPFQDERFEKMEKADILELTVNYVRQLQNKSLDKG